MGKLFPMGIALGEAFCNRKHEREHLMNNINTGTHTVLLAPRRYGKTSLATVAIEQSKLLYCQMDFLLSATPALVESQILDRVGQLLHKLLPKTKSPKEKMLQLFHRLRPEITISALGQKVVLHAPTDMARESTISDVLIALDQAAQSAKKRVVIFMDEFQQVGELNDHHTIEASIRHAVERSQNVSYIFSGSNRHLLSQLFNDKHRPFYRLCTVLELKRIKEQDYLDFIQKQAEKKWKKRLPLEVIESILTLSMCHPYYLNLICKYFWDRNIVPTMSKIKTMWEEYVLSQQSLIASDISMLSNNQKSLLLAIAKQPTQQLFSHDYLQRSQLSVASQRQALQALLLKDLVYQDEAKFTKLLDPAMQSFLAMLF